MPLELREANALVDALHRHHAPVVGHRFSIGAVKDGRLVGAVIVGRPVARMVDHRAVVEVTRLVTDGTRNACSCLYAAAARAAKEMGYAKIQTYILDSETGASLKGAGWECEGQAGGGSWYRESREENHNPNQPQCTKGRWSKRLADPLLEWSAPEATIPSHPDLFAEANP